MYGGTECPECYTRFMDSAEPEVIRCGLHGDVTVTDSGSNSGFAGEGVWWWTLSCGCHHMEEGVYTDM
jgi:hypothetical protein